MLDSIYILLFLSLLLSLFYFKLLNYNFFSIRGIVVLNFVIFYPAVALIIIVENIIFYDSEIDESIIISNSILAYIVLIAVLIVVEMIFNIEKYNNKGRHALKSCNQFNIRIIILIIFFISALILRFYLDVYYHVSLNPNYNVEANAFQSVIHRLHWLGLLPVFLFQYKYFQTGLKIYLFVSLLLALLAMLTYIPSGSRSTAFLFVPVYAIFTFSKLKKNRLLFSIVTLLLLATLISVSGKLRVKDVDFSQSTLKDDVRITVHRLSDFVVTGKIIDVVPSEYDFRYSKDIEVLLVTPFPRFLRSAFGIKEDFLDGVQYIWDINLSPHWTSVPVTLLGDFYSRYGWLGIFCFSILMALILALLEFILFKKDELFTTIFLSLYGAYLSQVYIIDLQVLFVTLTREFIIAYILAYIFSSFLRKRSV